LVKAYQIDFSLPKSSEISINQVPKFSKLLQKNIATLKAAISL
jgi:hypothetical protein